MPSIQNDSLIVFSNPDGSGLTLVDPKRKTHWILDERTQVWGGEPRPDLERPTGAPAVKPLIPVSAEAHDNRLTIQYRAGEIPLSVICTLNPEGVQVTLPDELPAEIGYVALPGSFAPAHEPLTLLLPIMQGMFW